MKTRVINLKNRPVGLPDTKDFEEVQENVPELLEGQILLQSIYISVDPYLRGRMSGTKEPIFKLNAPVSSKLIARIIQSRHKNFKTGDIVSHYLDWKEYQVSDGTGLKKIDQDGAPLSANLGVLGITGLSAYLPLTTFGKPQPGETIVISAAAGAVGSIAGQIGKILGCKVVGIVGSDQKVTLLKEKFGFDAAINYQTEKDLGAAIAAHCPSGVDIYFDNVGGGISDAVFANINTYGRVVVCGSISNYNDTEIALSPSILPIVVYKFLSIHGFLIADFAAQFDQALIQLSTWLQQGKLKYTETILEGFDKLPKAFIGLFNGLNEGKMIVKV
ncbi:NADP-dependent oxidoreductase [Dyadobacter subterraneus]|uniref:NADP-dependent oxidoreductase n=1 Tax=Dyadobacter subterraneus TaxID=2773304 RepID=A0ABR9W7B7_9BACT|nr:NADP-dependent oxidoreductase [Dyadobacter subterraneus]MBE9461362.1 NADP-dependent oxidoreductase [Dyadobacter subterraneus]